LCRSSEGIDIYDGEMKMDVRDVECNIDVAVNLLKALSNERRLRIICALYRGEKNVGEMESIIGLSQSALSQHLARLRRDGLVSTRRDAQTIYYSMDDRAAKAVLGCLCDIYNSGGKEDRPIPEELITQY
jgi:DNA-binding transcriptional ArsR family regulator